MRTFASARRVHRPHAEVNVNIITYSLMSYAITAGISFAVIGIVVLMSRALSKRES